MNGNVDDDMNCEAVEKYHVLDIYDKIASHFCETRKKPWPNVIEFVESLPGGSFMLDIGCGSGRYLGSSHIAQIGIDVSNKLLDICLQNNYHVMQASSLSLPFKDNFYDGIICIAVVHHLASEERRKQSIKEMMRVLRKGGECLIYVWALEQKRGKKLSSYLKQKRSNRHSDGKDTLQEDVIVSNGLPIHENRTEFLQQDVLVPWKLKGTNEVFHRFYHVFKEGELEELCNSIDGLNIIKSYYDEGNWCIKFKKS